MAQVIIMIAEEFIREQAERALDEFGKIFLPQQQATTQT